ncbi:TetR/AcrR family transcriptional regulator [Duganella sp. BJB488]|uniref:TetR/AcrR family transcriptional regulator n=1 Tax=unclassified Duganella TaxID=2636909 RepID=UPI000E34F7BC|nr:MULTISPECIES: TetR/AcrR family transcriptional regulator [unclassified Duganella]RFP08379.1 TetR/AcrR family transcriptional regulator [Duganella sp. BJB489]RFP18008.1 TetR/AcrR family transcriptional regulator [Duganella sp. BJB488]RFP37764.1 TetR/AcrR family transcriptional regulator [Duganella sp. BJB480]
MTERKTALAKPRRKPVQSRSWQTSLAIQDAFVQLLVEDEYDRITIRDIVMVAGVALGSFYEYFTSKEELARTCVHFRSKRILKKLEQSRAEAAGLPLVQGIERAVLTLVDMVMDDHARWGQHFLLERRHSALKQYRADYGRFTSQWKLLLEASEDWPIGRDAARPALTLSMLVYGALAHTAMSEDAKLDRGDVCEQLRLAAISYLAAWL